MSIVEDARKFVIYMLTKPGLVGSGEVSIGGPFQGAFSQTIKSNVAGTTIFVDLVGNLETELAGVSGTGELGLTSNVQTPYGWSKFAQLGAAAPGPVTGEAGVPLKKWSTF